MCKLNSKIQQYFNFHALYKENLYYCTQIFFRRMRPDWRYIVVVQHGCH